MSEDFLVSECNFNDVYWLNTYIRKPVDYYRIMSFTEFCDDNINLEPLLDSPLISSILFFEIIPYRESLHNFYIDGVFFSNFNRITSSRPIPLYYSQTIEEAYESIPTAERSMLNSMVCDHLLFLQEKREFDIRLPKDYQCLDRHPLYNY